MNPSSPDYIKKLGDPGEYPFTRGIHPQGYATKVWTMRQYSGLADAKETNKRFRYLIDHGQTGISVAFDLPTQMGYDPTHLMAMGEIGKAGVSISTLNDMQTLFDSIQLDKTSVSMTINATAPILLALIIEVASKSKVNEKLLSGTVQNDILKEFIARGCYIYEPEPSLKLAVDLIEYSVKTLPKWNFISVSGYHIREAGSTASQELGFTLANAICYMNSSMKRGLDVNELGRRISFFFNVHNNFLEEIAKFRAARRLWARIMKERFRSADPRAMALRFHAQTAGSTLTSQQPENNVVRVSLQAMAAALGGAQSIHTNAMDEALALPTEKSAKTALRTQQILAYETGIQDVVDPFAGSYYLEQLTDKIEQEAESYINKIDEIGGALEAIKRRFYQTEIEKSALEYQRKVEKGEYAVVGVNKYIEDDNVSFDIQKVDEKLQGNRRDEIEQLTKSRDKKLAIKTLDELKRAQAKGENLMIFIRNCVKSSVTLGEICEALSASWPRFRPK